MNFGCNKYGRPYTKPNKRSNIDGETPNDDYRRSIFFPLLDGIVNILDKNIVTKICNEVKLFTAL